VIETTLKLSPEARRIVNKWPGTLVPAIRMALIEGMTRVEASAKGDYLSGRALQRRTGRLRNSITTSVVIEGNRVVGRIGSNVVYARIHELGGVIRPKTAKALRFQVGGDWVATQQVTMLARPYLRPAIEDNLDQISDRLTRRIEEHMMGVR